jgi:general secretion pathway protein N
MIKHRETWNIASGHICGATALLVGAFVGFGDARAETISRFGEITTNAPDEIRDRPAVNRVTTPARPRQESSLTGNPLWDVALSSLQETRARPLFSPSRRPPSPPIVAALPPPTPKPPPPKEPDRLKLTLLGTVVGASDRIGVFMDEASKEVVRIRTGESRDGWTLRSVQRRATSFERNNQEMTLALSPPVSEPSAPSLAAVASRAATPGISANDRGAANLADNRARPAVLALPASAPLTPGAQKVRHEIRQDILSIGVQN